MLLGHLGRELMGEGTMMSRTLSRAASTVILTTGFCLHNAWVCAAMYSPEVLGATARLPGALSGNYSLLYLTSIVGFALAAFMAARFDQSIIRFSRSRRAMAVVAALACGGTLLALAPGGTAMETVAGVVTGVGSAGLALYWGIALSRASERDAVVSVPVGVVLGFALNSLVIREMAAPAGGVVVALLPLGEWLCLSVVTPALSANVLPKFNTLSDGKARFGRLLLETAASVGIALGVLKQTAVQGSLGGVLTPATPVVLLVAGAMVVALYAVFPLVKTSGNWDALFTAVCPAAACALLVVAFFVADYGPLFDLFLAATYFLYESLTWAYCAILAHRLRLSPVFVFGMVRGMLTMAMFLGVVAIAYVAPLVGSGIDSRGFVFIPMALILLARAATPKESKLLRETVRCPAVRLAVLEMDERLALLETNRSQSVERAKELQKTGAGADEAASGPDGPAAGAGAGPADTGGRFSRRVRKVAAIYLLTERETDILFELAKGNSAAYIQEKLCISAGTVKTHVRNIYRKCDIHKRNDLMRLIEEIDDYD